jgi:uncharacterized repeat protein (TIGR02543 family)
MAKKFLSILLAFSLCFSSAGMETVWAATQEMDVADISMELDDTVKRTEDLIWNEVPLTEAETNRLLEKTDVVSEDGVFYTNSMRVHSAAYGDEWDQYSTNYIYNQLSSQLRELWDQLDAVCLKYLTTDADVPTIPVGGGKVYAIDQIASSSISTTVMNNLGLLFKYCNPQYYFLNDSIYYGTSNANSKRTNVFTIGVYSEFASGDSRSAATKRVKKQLTSWKKTLSKYTSDYDIALAAHDLIMDKVVYDEDIYDSDYDEDSRYSQSAYSVLCGDLTVCAGYTLAYEMIMNAMGVDCIGVTSDEHAWNKVILEDNWYNVDCTWDDTGGKYFYFARNDINIKGDGYHNPTGLWVYYLPECTMDTYSGYSAPGELPVVSSVAKTPKINIIKNTNSYLVTIETDTQGAEIYYTTDGTTPSCAATRSELYVTGFPVQAGTVIRAIAVADQAMDSQEVTAQAGTSSGSSDMNTQPQTVSDPGDSQTPGNVSLDDPDDDTETPKEEYQITYELDGGTNNAENPLEYDGTQKITLKDPEKIGYTFKGWYSRSDYSVSLSVIKEGTTGDITLYAKWTPNTYKILFKGNGSTKGTMAKLSCKFGQTYTLTANKFKRTGYTFTGWNTKANGKGTSYHNKASIKNLTAISGNKIVLYAQWTKK